MWEQIAVQLPIVAAFVWFVLEMDKRNAAYAAKRDEQWRAFLKHQSEIFVTALDEVSTAVRELGKSHNQHDQIVRENIIRMETAAGLRQDPSQKRKKAQPNN